MCDGKWLGEDGDDVDSLSVSGLLSLMGTHVCLYIEFAFSIISTNVDSN